MSHNFKCSICWQDVPPDGVPTHRCKLGGAFQLLPEPPLIPIPMPPVRLDDRSLLGLMAAAIGGAQPVKGAIDILRIVDIFLAGDRAAEVLAPTPAPNDGFTSIAKAIASVRPEDYWPPAAWIVEGTTMVIAGEKAPPPLAPFLGDPPGLKRWTPLYKQRPPAGASQDAKPVAWRKYSATGATRFWDGPIVPETEPHGWTPLYLAPAPSAAPLLPEITLEDGDGITVSRDERKYWRGLKVGEHHNAVQVCVQFSDGEQTPYGQQVIDALVALGAAPASGVPPRAAAAPQAPAAAAESAEGAPEPQEFECRHAEEWSECLDAFIVSSNLLGSRINRARLRWYLERWISELQIREQPLHDK